MDITAIRYQQLKMEGVLKILSGSRKSIPGAPVSKTGNTSNTFNPGFASVTLLEEDVTACYGNVKISGSHQGNRTKGCHSGSYEEPDEALVNAVELPASYDSLKDCKVYYHGESISEYRLIQIAVASGKMELSESTPDYKAAKEAFQVMIENNAQAKYVWSKTRYSEDGKYTFTLQEDGSYKRHLVEDLEMGTSLEEIADWICSGTPNRNIETRYLHYLRSVDPDLYNAAQNIGKEVRTYRLMTTAYDVGLLGDAQHDYDLSLLALLFGEHDLEKFHERFQHCKKSGNYQYLLEHYQPEMADHLTNLRQQQLMKSGGIL
ncbi:MAG: hypothetical protein HDR27_07080 [Lachnospiraceae bacterium]|nr:hypothetical protein [Lachnospiraceae bacterium]